MVGRPVELPDVSLESDVSVDVPDSAPLSVESTPRPELPDSILIDDVDAVPRPVVVGEPSTVVSASVSVALGAPEVVPSALIRSVLSAEQPAATTNTERCLRVRAHRIVATLARRCAALSTTGAGDKVLHDELPGTAFASAFDLGLVGHSLNARSDTCR